jgi:hypothetical protein
LFSALFSAVAGGQISQQPPHGQRREKAVDLRRSVPLKHDHSDPEISLTHIAGSLRGAFDWHVFVFLILDAVLISWMPYISFATEIAFTTEPVLRLT